MAREREYTGLGRNGYGTGAHIPGYTGLGRNGMGQGNHGGNAYTPRPQPAAPMTPQNSGIQDRNSQLRDALRTGMQGMGMQPMPRGGIPDNTMSPAINGLQGVGAAMTRLPGIMGAQGQGYPAQPTLSRSQQALQWFNTPDSKRGPITQYRQPQQLFNGITPNVESSINDAWTAANAAMPRRY